MAISNIVRDKFFVLGEELYQGVQQAALDAARGTVDRAASDALPKTESTVHKTIAFGQRFFSGALGAFLPYAVWGAVQHAQSQDPFMMANYSNGMVVAGAGLIAATFASRSWQALKAGALVGSTAIAKTVLCQNSKVVDLIVSTAIKQGSEAMGQVCDAGIHVWQEAVNRTVDFYQNLNGTFCPRKV